MCSHDYCKPQFQRKCLCTLSVDDEMVSNTKITDMRCNMGIKIGKAISCYYPRERSCSCCRHHVKPHIKDSISPRNILMIGECIKSISKSISIVAIYVAGSRLVEKEQISRQGRESMPGLTQNKFAAPFSPCTLRVFCSYMQCAISMLPVLDSVCKSDTRRNTRNYSCRIGP